MLERAIRDPAATRTAEQGVATPLKILIVDDDPLAVAALEVRLDALDGIAMQSTWGSPAEVIAECKRCSPDVVLVDLSLPANGPDGIELAVTLSDACAGCTPIVLAASQSPNDAYRAWSAGLGGYLTKWDLAENIEQLPALIRCVLSGTLIFQVDPRSAPADLDPGLSDRELDILTRKARGQKHREIAHQLCLSLRTIDSHLANARIKLGATSIHEALQIARQRGFIKEPTGSGDGSSSEPG